MTHSMFGTQALEDASVITPVEIPVAHVVVGGVVNHTRPTLAVLRVVDVSERVVNVVVPDLVHAERDLLDPYVSHHYSLLLGLSVAR